jgi:broad specificity phosphatase PhoE
MKRFLERLADFNKKINTEYNISESSSEVYACLKKGMDGIIDENPNGGNITLVAHGQSISFLCAAIRVEFSGQWGNSSITKLVCQPVALVGFSGFFWLKKTIKTPIKGRLWQFATYRIEVPVGDMSYTEAGANR